MPFGLTTALAMFENLVNDMLGDMLNKFVFQNYSSIAAWLHQLIYTKSKFSWSQGAKSCSLHTPCRENFTLLKEHFISATILVLLDPAQ